MKKTFTLRDLECADCAEKMESAIGKLDGVVAVDVRFMTQKMTLEAPDDRFDDVLAQAKKVIAKIEPDVVVES